MATYSSTRLKAVSLIAVSLSCLSAPAAQAQEYPSRMVRMVVPFPPAGSGDVIARVLAEKLAPIWHQPVVVDNKPGASSNIGSDAVAKAAPDGYTLLLVPNNVPTINPFMSARMPYDPVKDLQSVMLLGTTPFVLVAGPSMKVDSVKELVAAAKSRPKGITYASSGTGSVHHLFAELFHSLTQAPMTHVPYKGGAPAVVDLLAGLVDVQFGAVTALAPNIRSGKLKALAVTGVSRSRDLPDVPTMVEAGIAGFESEAWIGLSVPAGTPDAVVQRINRDIRTVMAQKDVVAKLAEQGIEAHVTTPAQMDARIEAERRQWSKVIADANLRTD